MVKIDDAILAATRTLYEAMHRFDVHAAQALGLHVTDLRCVNALEAGPLSAGEIGARLALSSGSVTALINRLVAAGMAERLPDPSDRRRALVALAPRFRAEADRVYGRLGAALLRSFGDARPDDRVLLARALSQLARAFDDAS